jgi:hypothetical protein
MRCELQLGLLILEQKTRHLSGMLTASYIFFCHEGGFRFGLLCLCYALNQEQGTTLNKEKSSKSGNSASLRVC